MQLLKTMKFNKLYILLFVLAFVGFLIFLISFLHATGDDLVKGEQHLVIQSNVVMDESNVAALLAGQIDDVLVSEGDIVVIGQELAILNSDNLQAQKEQAEASLSQAQAAYAAALKGASSEAKQQLQLAVDIANANLQNAQAAFDMTQDTYEKMERLHEAGALSDIDLESQRVSMISAQTAFENAKSNLSISQSRLTEALNGATPESLQQASAAVKQAEASLKNIETNIRKCVLVSPINGGITNVNIKKGDLVSSGFPAVVITDTAHPYIICNVDETDLSNVYSDQEVQISLLQDMDTAYLGKVVRINRNADFATKKASNENGNYDIRTYGVKVEFEQPEALEDVLHSGMTALVDFGKQRG